MQRGQKWAQTMRQTRHLGLMYVFFFLLRVFIIINSCIIVSAYQIMMEKGGDKGNGPNDVSDVSFGPYVCVFFFLCVFLLLAHVL